MVSTTVEVGELAAVEASGGTRDVESWNGVTKHGMSKRERGKRRAPHVWTDRLDRKAGNFLPANDANWRE